jgi:predicted regulator of Ras-like GTPase activity (Roadblock/LC7/MglB family)
MFNENQLSKIENVLKNGMIGRGVESVLLIDMAGNMIVSLDNGEEVLDKYSMAALAAGNYGAVNAIANIVGEQEFSLQFHKGKKTNIHFRRIPSDYLLISLFQNDLSLGFLRLLVEESSTEIENILGLKYYSKN